MRTLILVLAAIVVAVPAALWIASAPRPLTAAELPDHTPDPENGRLVFNAAGCAACHAASGARDEERYLLGGGQKLESPVGSFVVPNVSTHPEDGIGGWSTADFVNAVMRGIAPDGRYYYPAFPWPSYRNMAVADAIDLKAFMDTLPAVEGDPGGTDLAFPANLRRGIGLWQRVALADPPPVADDAPPEVVRGAYLANVLGHCGECHSPRTRLMALDPSRWMAGAPDLDGDGFVPNLTPSDDGLDGWSAGDIAYLLETGFTPDFDSIGGHMAAVVDNWAHVPQEDRRAVAAYLLSLPPLPDAR